MATAVAHPFEQRVADTQISKSEINNLVMDYLITEGYPSAAEKFAAEANIQHKADFSHIQERVQIRDSIHRGDLQMAIELINELNPELLDTNKKLHFSLLRLQLVELIRNSFVTSDATAVGKAIEFAQNNLAPYAPLDAQFKHDLERAMALLIVPRESWLQAQPSATISATPTTARTTQQPTISSTTAASSISQGDFGALAELVDPSLRRKVAKDVNEAILQSQGERREANIRYLVRARAWAEQLAREKKIGLPDKLNLGLDGDGSTGPSSAATVGNGHARADTVMSENGASTTTSRPASGTPTTTRRRSGDAELARYTNIS